MLFILKVLCVNILFDLSDVPVYLSDLDDERDDQILAGFCELHYVSSMIPHKVIITVTPEMEQLYNMVTVGTDVGICLGGPPGVGKTTSLFWLYKQLVVLDNFLPVVIPFEDLGKYKKTVIDGARAQVTRFPQKKPVLLMDMLKPLQNMGNMALFRDIFLRIPNRRVVVAQSSSFDVLQFIEPYTVSGYMNGIFSAEHITYKPYDDALAEKFLNSMFRESGNTPSETIPNMVRYCKGIPKCLSFCHSSSFQSKIEKYQHHEFMTVLQFMAKHPTVVNWKSELNLLLAARFKMKIGTVGLTRSSAKECVMCRSYLVSINDEDVPVLYFPNKKESIETILRTTSSHWMSWRGYDSNAVLGDFFECKISSVITPTLSLVVRKLHGVNAETKTITVNINDGTHQRLESSTLSLPRNDFLWRMPLGQKAMDFMAKFDADLPGSEICPTPTLMAVQVTIQSRNHAEKIRKSISGITGTHNVLFVLINPLWDDFNQNYDFAVDATSGASNKQQSRYKQWWYGQPAQFESIVALYRQLQSMLI